MLLAISDKDNIQSQQRHEIEVLYFDLNTHFHFLMG